MSDDKFDVEIADFKTKIKNFLDMSKSSFDSANSLPSMLYSSFKDELVKISQSGGKKKIKKTIKKKLKRKKSKTKHKIK